MQVVKRNHRNEYKHQIKAEMDRLTKIKKCNELNENVSHGQLLNSLTTTSDIGSLQCVELRH